MSYYKKILQNNKTEIPVLEAVSIAVANLNLGDSSTFIRDESIRILLSLHKVRFPQRNWIIEYSLGFSRCA